MIVRGPGQNVRAKVKAKSGTTLPYRSRSSMPPTNQAMGFFFSRCLMVYRISGLGAWSTETPRPNNVSVGKTTGLPLFSAARASSGVCDTVGIVIIAFTIMERFAMQPCAWR